jgi:hypothetical protein
MTATIRVRKVRRARVPGNRQRACRSCALCRDGERRLKLAQILNREAR